MVLDFLTTDWGHLCDGDRCALSSIFSLTAHISFSNTHVIFKPGKNRDGWFSADNLLDQVDHKIDVFKGLTKGWAQGLVLFINAPSHQKHADNTLSAHWTVKGACIQLLQAHADGSHLFSTKEGLGTSSRGCTPVLQNTIDWRATALLFPQGPSNHARLV